MTTSPTQTLTFLRDAGQDWACFPRTILRLHTPGRRKALERELGLLPLEVGSSPECDVVCADPRLSRRHLQLSLSEQGILVEDLGSKNGTFVSGIRISRVWLSPGQTILAGSSRLELEVAQESAKVALSRLPRFGDADGVSVVMRGLFADLHRAAAAEGTLLLWGETGSGKEVLARAVHQHSPRASGPFVIFDCGAVPAALLEAELFGHEKGAFTGAESARAGLVERAHGGTLFLDEIGELPLHTQTALLRVLEQRSIRRLGASEPVEVDVRFIAATHRDLRSKVASKEFREDLYFRLAVLELTVPPLRQRLEDIPLLVQHFLAEKQPTLTLAQLPPGVLEMFQRHRWPGNVRELKNVVERLVTYPGLPAEQLLDQRRSPDGGETSPSLSHLPLRQAREEAVERFEKAYFREQLKAHHGKVAEAAEAMGVSRQFLYRMLAKYDLRSAE